MAALVKILVGGPANAGKTRFIQTAVHGEQWLIVEAWQQRKAQVCAEGIRMDAHLGEIRIADDLSVRLVNLSPRTDKLHLQKWQIVSEGSLGHIFLLDSTQPNTFSDLLYTVETLQGFSHVPYLIAANKQDLPGALGIDAIRQKLALDASPPVRNQWTKFCQRCWSPSRTSLLIKKV